MQEVVVGETGENVVMGYVLVDTPLQHWDYWDAKPIRVMGKKKKIFSSLCSKAHGLLRYTKCVICRQRDSAQ